MKTKDNGKILLDGYKTFKQEFKKAKKKHLELALKGQSPEILWIGCSDSRIIPHKLLNVGHGELFIARNIANIIPPIDANDFGTSSVLEFAANNLHVKNIIICGHTDCGGIKFLLSEQSKKQKSFLASWVKNAAGIKKQLKKKSGSGKDIITEAVKENLLLQRKNILSFNFMDEKVREGKIKIHLWYYDLFNGKIFALDESSNSWDELSMKSINKLL